MKSILTIAITAAVLATTSVARAQDFCSSIAGAIGGVEKARDKGLSQSDMEAKAQKIGAEHGQQQLLLSIVKGVYASPLSGDKLVESLVSSTCRNQLFPAAQEAPSQMSFYGIEIGRPLQLPECPKEKDPLTNKMRSRLFGVSYKCAETYPDGAWVRFPSTEGPLYSGGDGITVVIVDGTVQLAQLMTSGLMSQGVLLQELTAKYGSPTRSGELSMTNQLGTTFISNAASWDLGDQLQVRFSGMVGRTDQGLLLVGTKRGFEVDAARQKARDAASRRPTM